MTASARPATGLYATKPLFQRLLTPAVGWCARRGISADALTAAGLAAALAASMLIWLHLLPLLAGGLLLARLLLNVMDGQLARSTGRSTARGGRRNEMADALADAAVLVALGLGGQVEPRLALLALAAVGLAEAAGLLHHPRLQGGLFGKGDRTLLVAAALPLGLTGPALVAVALLSLVTLWQRWRWLEAHGDR